MLKDEEEMQEDVRSPVAKGLAWSVTISGIGMQALLPALLGLWLDFELGTRVIFMLSGLFLGLISAGTQLMRILKNHTASR
ncbi:MAG: hypothetical protein Q4C96_08170 [Planctomycetia bacterium]|nr:hypothetical protein [Planctomycetia bacterium]